MAAETLVICRAVVCLTFALSAAGKVRDMGAFVHGVRSFKLLPSRWNAPVAWALLAAEAAVVVLQLAGPGAAVAGLGLALALLAAYTVALGLLLVRRSDVRCNCFGPATRTVSAFDLVRNLLLAGVTVAGMAAAWAGPRTLPVADAALLLPASAAIVLLAVSLDDIAAVLRTPPRNDD